VSGAGGHCRADIGAMHRLISSWVIVTVLSGCATTLTTYVPRDGQAIAYDQGVGTVTARSENATIMMYPTFRYQEPADIPTFTLMVQNNTDHDIDFNPDGLTATVDNQICRVYSMEERVAEIRRSAKHKQIALAIAGGLAAAGAGYAASRQTTTFTNVGYVGHRGFYSSGTFQSYDPAAGIFTGVAIGAAAGVGVHQIGKVAGYEAQAAQSIFQRTTIRPGTTAIGQVELKSRSVPFSLLSLAVPLGGTVSQLQFQRQDTP
jgi:hypothetical protein